MTISVQNNSAALTALQNLNRANDQLANVQQEISTTLAVAQPKDNPSVWATAHGQQVDINGLGAVTQSLNRASSISDVALSAGQSVVDLLNQIKTDVLSAQDPQLDTAGRADILRRFRHPIPCLTCCFGHRIPCFSCRFAEPISSCITGFHDATQSTASSFTCPIRCFA